MGGGQSGVIDKKLPSQLRQYCLCCRSTLLSQSHNSPGNSYSVNGDNRKFFDGNATGYTVTVTRLSYSCFVIISDYGLEWNVIRLMVQYGYSKGIEVNKLNYFSIPAHTILFNIVNVTSTNQNRADQNTLFTLYILSYTAHFTHYTFAEYCLNERPKDKKFDYYHRPFLLLISLLTIDRVSEDSTDFTSKCEAWN